jgi:hypothetical protein
VTPERIVAAFRKEQPSMSGFFVAPDNHSHVLAFDFDSDDGEAKAVRLGKTLWVSGIPAYLEPSRRGAHLWVVFEERLPARVIRRAARYFLERSDMGMVPDHKRPGFIVPDPKIEIRPGQDTVADGGVGLALRLPTMPHPKTGVRHPLYNPCGNHRELQIGANLAEMLKNLSLAPAKWAVQASADYVAPVDPRSISKVYKNPRAEQPDEFAEASVCDMLRDYWGVTNARPGKAIRCPAHDDQMPSLSILRDDRRVICKSPPCDLNNNDRGRGSYELYKMAPKKAVTA